MPIKLPLDISEDDVYQWLSDGYFLIDGEPWVFFGELERSSSFWTCLCAKIDDGYEPVRKNLSEIECFWPICGAINVQHRGRDMVVYVERQQRRQWRRTFNSTCVSTHVIGGWGVRKAMGSAPVVRTTSQSVIQQLANPTYYTPSQAMRRIQRGALSAAVSPQVSMVGDGKGQYAVYYRMTMVGGLRDGTFTPSLKGYAADMARQALQEVIHNA